MAIVILLIFFSEKENHIGLSTHHIDEDTLVARLRSRDRAALEYLYDHYAAALNGVIFRILKKEEVSEEVLQDVFLKIWERFDSYDATKGKLFTWMVNIARNQAIDKTRSKEISKDSKTGTLEKVVGKIDREGFVETAIEGIGLKDLLKYLSDDQRFVVEHLYFQGYSQSELADEFKIPLGTVKTRLRLAMQQLRNSLGVS